MTFTFQHPQYGPVRVIFTEYISTRNTCIRTVDEAGAPMWTATFNPPNNLILPTNQVAIKNWSENVGIEQWLIEAGVLGEKVGICASGFIEAPIYELTFLALGEVGK